jgi:hypothetical protein
MLLAWLLPESSSTLLYDGWKRPIYRPKHCRPPLVVRIWQTLGVVFADARDRYLGLGEEEAMTRAPRPAS